MRRSVSGTSLSRRSHPAQSRSISISSRTPSQFVAESPLDDARYSSPCSPVMGMLHLDQDSELEFSAAVELTHEDPYGAGFSSAGQLSEAPYTLSVQSASLDQSTNPSPSSVLSPQPMRYPQLAPLLSISIPGGEEVPALESSSSSSPASPPSQTTPLLDYQGMYDHNFVSNEFGYDRCVSRLLLSAPFVSEHRYLQFHPLSNILCSPLNSVSSIRSDPSGNANGLLL